ncbi:hypothetical protein GCM10023157_08620 [Gluconacetobacter asukensis]
MFAPLQRRHAQRVVHPRVTEKVDGIDIRAFKAGQGIAAASGKAEFLPRRDGALFHHVADLDEGKPPGVAQLREPGQVKQA